MKELKTLIITLIFLQINNISFSQENTPLYKGLLYKMAINDAKKEFKKDKEEYTNISFGDGVSWRMYTQNFHSFDNKLTALILTPKGYPFGMDHELAEVNLIKSKEFFISKGYSVFGEPKNWDIPVLFSPHNKSGLLLFDPNKTIFVELRSVLLSELDLTYVVNLVINNYDNYLNYLESQEQIKKSEQDNTGF